MTETDQQELFIEPRNRRLRRGIYLLPGAFTVGNLLCGFYAILATVKGGVLDLDYAARAIGFAILFDAFDGFVARATGTGTEFGKQFDSLADMVSFGIAPAILAYIWGVRAIVQSDSAQSRHIYDLAWVVSLAFALCCAWRLARFNVHGMAPGGLRYFVGMPTPGAAGVVAAIVHAWKYPIENWRWSAAWLALVLLLAALMVSSIRFASFKALPWGKRQHSLTIVAVGLLVWSIVVYSEVALFLIATGYLAISLTIHLVRAFRQRLVSRHA